MVTKASVPKEYKGEQQTDKDGAPKWVTAVLALEQGNEDDDGQIIRVVTAGEKPKFTKTQQVIPVGLEAVPWEKNGNHGISYRAIELKDAKAAK
ncbi:hypothetical protein [Glycomyces tarimensis]